MKDEFLVFMILWKSDVVKSMKVKGCNEKMKLLKIVFLHEVCASKGKVQILVI